MRHMAWKIPSLDDEIGKNFKEARTVCHDLQRKPIQSSHNISRMAANISSKMQHKSTRKWQQCAQQSSSKVASKSPKIWTKEQPILRLQNSLKQAEEIPAKCSTALQNNRAKQSTRTRQTHTYPVRKVRQLEHLFHNNFQPNFPDQPGRYQVQITSFQTNQKLLKTDKQNANSFGSKLSRKMHNYRQFLTSRKSNTAPKIQHNISIKSLFKTGSNEPKIMQNSAG